MNFENNEYVTTDLDEDGTFTLQIRLTQADMVGNLPAEDVDMAMTGLLLSFAREDNTRTLLSGIGQVIDRILWRKAGSPEDNPFGYTDAVQSDYSGEGEEGAEHAAA